MLTIERLADLITSASDGSIVYPSAEEMVEQCGKLELLDRLLVQLHAGGHKVLIFSQVSPISGQPAAGLCKLCLPLLDLCLGRISLACTA